MRDILNKKIFFGKNRLFERGFTLIELLVAVLIVGILAAIALPLYQRAVQRSKVSDALSNLEIVSLKQQDYLLSHETYATNFKDLNVHIDGLYDKAGTEAQVGNFKYALSDGCVTATYNPKKKDGSAVQVKSEYQYTICRSPETNTVKCDGGFCSQFKSLVPEGSCSACTYSGNDDGPANPDKDECTLDCSKTCPDGSSRNGTCKFKGPDMYCDWAGVPPCDSPKVCDNGVAYGQEGVGNDKCDGICEDGSWRSYKTAAGKVWDGKECVDKGTCSDDTMQLNTVDGRHYCRRWKNGLAGKWIRGVSCSYVADNA